MIQEEEELGSIDGQIECENPNPNLQSFMGRIKVGIYNHWLAFICSFILKPLEDALYLSSASNHQPE